MLTEHQLIEEIQRRFGGNGNAVGIGDDAAVVDLPPGLSTVLCADMLVEGTHFRRSTHPPHALGYKGIAVNISDVGAMGGTPAFAMLSLAVPADLDPDWIFNFLDGVAAACRDFGVHLVGGDSSAARNIFIDVSVVGHIRPGHAVSRANARPGDRIFVSGSLGGAADGLQRIEAGARLDEDAVRRHLYPIPRHRIGRAVASQATAMIDVSDGFSIDLGHILDASQVSARVESSQIPRAAGATMEMALHGGEDYELIITGRNLPNTVDAIPITEVGQIVESTGTPKICLVTETGESVLARKGWQHF